MFGPRSGLAVVLALVAFPALTDTLNQYPDYRLPTIIISPEWREVDLQRTPSTVHMLSGQQLETVGVDSTRDLQYRIPGLTLKSSGGLGAGHLRGVGGTVSATGDSGVATFVDGIYLTGAVQALQDFYDIERVEVIKGPHGVHLGRNVVGGAINIITRDPEPYREAYADVLYGENNQRQLRGAYNLPIPDADLSLRLAGTLLERDGYSRNVFLGEDLDDQDAYAWRGKLRYRPSSNLDMILSAQQSSQDDSLGLGKQPDPDVGVNGGILLGGTVPGDPRKVTHNVDENQDTKTGLYSVKLISGLGDTELQSITAYQTADQDVVEDLDGTEVDFSSSLRGLSTRAISQEFRLGSPRDQPVTWVAGLFFLHEEASQQFDLRFPLTAVQSVADSDTDNSAYAVFGELSYLLAPDWRGRIGLRYNHDESELDLRQTLVDPFGVQGAAGITAVRKKDRDHWGAGWQQCHPATRLPAFASLSLAGSE